MKIHVFELYVPDESTFFPLTHTHIAIPEDQIHSIKKGYHRNVVREGEKVAKPPETFWLNGHEVLGSFDDFIQEWQVITWKTML